MDINEGIRSAKLKATQSRTLYQKAVEIYGRTIQPLLGHFPFGLALGHLLQVNPALSSTPPSTTDRRRGFMYAPFQESRKANVSWESLDKPLNAMYIWGRDVNRCASSIYTQNSSLFSSPGVDFWRTTYLKHVLGDSSFKLLWALKGTTEDTVYGNLVYAVNSMNQSNIPGWPINRLKTTVLLNCQYVFEISKFRGKLITKGYGIQPVLDKDAMTQIYYSREDDELV